MMLCHCVCVHARVLFIRASGHGFMFQMLFWEAIHHVTSLFFSFCLCVQCDGVPMSLPSLQGLAVLNIPSYAGGINFWGGTKEHNVSPSMKPNFSSELITLLSGGQFSSTKWKSSQSWTDESVPCIYLQCISLMFWAVNKQWLLARVSSCRYDFQKASTTFTATHQSINSLSSSFFKNNLSVKCIVAYKQEAIWNRCGE